MKIKSARLWTADSAIRDFRKAVWRAKEFPVGDEETTLSMTMPKTGFRAWIGEVTIQNEDKTMTFSTTAFVNAK